MAKKRKTKKQLEAELKQAKDNIYELVMRPDSMQSQILKTCVHMNDRLERAFWLGDTTNLYA